MSNSIRTIPDLTVGTTAVPLTPQNNPNGKGSFHKWASVAIQNNSATAINVYVGDSLVSTSRKSAFLAQGQTYSISGSAIDPSLIYVLADAPGAIVSASGS